MHQGAVDAAHLPSYLNEFVFRFNRRRSRSRGMLFYRILELAVAHAPGRYKDLVAAQRPRTVSPKPQRNEGIRTAWRCLPKAGHGGGAPTPVK
jgi:hypothetical protein